MLVGAELNAELAKKTKKGAIEEEMLVTGCKQK